MPNDNTPQDPKDDGTQPITSANPDSNTGTPPEPQQNFTPQVPGQDNFPSQANTQSPSDSTSSQDAASTGATLNTPQEPEIITAPHAPKKYGGNKVIATIFGIILILGAVVGGVYLAQKPSFRIGQAWDCSLYVFEVGRDGVVTIRNGSSRNEPAQSADVYINGTKVATFDVPALVPGNAANIGTVTVPSQDGFTWRVDGSLDCDDEGSYGPSATSTPTQTPKPTLPPKVSAQCGEVKAYTSTWGLLSQTELNSLEAGDEVRFTISGTTSSGSFDKAKFSVNGTDMGETSLKKPASDEFYVEYTIPGNTTSFTVDAQIHHSELGWF